MPGTFILQIAGGWLSCWIRVMLILPSLVFKLCIAERNVDTWWPLLPPALGGAVSSRDQSVQWEALAGQCLVLAVSSVCHPLNIITNRFFCSPCPWWHAFSSHGKENKKTLKNGLWPFCCSLYNSNNGGGRQKVFHVYSLHLCSQGGGEGNVWHGLCSFLSKHGYSS